MSRGIVGDQIRKPTDHSYLVCVARAVSTKAPRFKIIRDPVFSRSFREIVQARGRKRRVGPVPSPKSYVTLRPNNSSLRNLACLGPSIMVFTDSGDEDEDDLDVPHAPRIRGMHQRSEHNRRTEALERRTRTTMMRSIFRQVPQE